MEGDRRMAETAANEAQGIGPQLRSWAPGRVLLNWFRELTLVPVIVLLMILGWVLNPVFFTGPNLVDVTQRAAATGVVVVAETLILLTGKFDLSLQGTYGLAPLLGAWLVAPGKQNAGLGTEWNPFVGLAVVLLAAAV